MNKQLTIQQVADILQCEHKAVRAMISRGELKAYRYGPRMIRINPEDLKAMGTLVAEEAMK